MSDQCIVALLTVRAFGIRVPGEALSCMAHVSKRPYTVIYT